MIYIKEPAFIVTRSIRRDGIFARVRRHQNALPSGTPVLERFAIGCPADVLA
jgi:hypothetical protein